MSDKSTDVLIRHQWESLVLQIAVSNALVSFYAYACAQWFEEQQRNAALVWCIAGVVQTVTILAMFGISLYPGLPHNKERLWHVRARAAFILTLNAVGLLLAPAIAFIIAMHARDLASPCFLWNIVAVFNTVALLLIMSKTIVHSLVRLVMNP